MCSGPSSSMIAVPDAALLPMTARPVRRENSLDDLRGKSPGERRERAIEHDTHHLPVAGDRILARRRLRHSTNGRTRPVVGWRSAQRDQPIESKRAQRRHSKRHAPGDVAQRVASAIAVRVGIRQLADPDAVHDDHNRTRESAHRRPTCRRKISGCHASAAAYVIMCRASVSRRGSLALWPSWSRSRPGHRTT